MASSFINSQPLTTTPLFVKPRHFPKIKKPFLSYKISCKSSTHNDQESSSSSQPRVKLDRRNVVIGLGAGLYGSASPFSFAAPISAPDVSQCGPADLPAGADPTNCCPPQTSKIIDFKLPPPPSKLRIRAAAHLVDDAYLAKFNRAVELMRALPDDDPRSFKQQADIHCAYCDGAYDQVGVGLWSLSRRRDPARARRLTMVLGRALLLDQRRSSATGDQSIGGARAGDLIERNRSTKARGRAGSAAVRLN